MKDGSLKYTLETERRLDVGVFVVWGLEPRRGIGDRLLQIFAQTRDVGAAILENLDNLGRIEQREQQVLNGNEPMTLLAGTLERLI
jgi:hypothetical protein